MIISVNIKMIGRFIVINIFSSNSIFVYFCIFNYSKIILRIILNKIFKSFKDKFLIIKSFNFFFN